jgi:outer membrane protein assembly factor BamB
VAGLSHSGELLWRKELGAFPTNNGFGTGSSLAILEDAIFAQHFTEKSASLTCFESASGTVRWSDNRDQMGSSWSSPIVWVNSIRPELISSGGEKLISYSPKTGEKLWMLSNVKAPTACSVASDSQRIYFGGSDPMSKGPLFAVRAGASGDISPKKKNDSFEYCDWLEKKAAPGMASPVSTGIHIVVLDNNILRAYDATSGKKIQERRLGKLKMIASSPLVVDNNVLVLDEEGNAILLDSTQEYAAVGNGKIDDTFWSTPAIANDSIYLRGINSLYCIRTAQAGSSNP